MTADIVSVSVVMSQRWLRVVAMRTAAGVVEARAYVHMWRHRPMRRHAVGPDRGIRCGEVEHEAERDALGRALDGRHKLGVAVAHERRRRLRHRLGHPERELHRVALISVLVVMGAVRVMMTVRDMGMWMARVVRIVVMRVVRVMTERRSMAQDVCRQHRRQHALITVLQPRHRGRQLVVVEHLGELLTLPLAEAYVHMQGRRWVMMEAHAHPVPRPS